MNLQSLVRDKIIANVKIGTKTESGLPKKLPYFNVEEDKATSIEMVEIFKKLYPDKPTKLKIMFTCLLASTCLQEIVVLFFLALTFVKKNWMNGMK